METLAKCSMLEAYYRAPDTFCEPAGAILMTRRTGWYCIRC